MSAIEYIQTHPLIAFTVAITHIAMAEIIPKVEIPAVIMQLFQIGAWTITMTVGLITIYGAFKKWYKSKKNDK